MLSHKKIYPEISKCAFQNHSVSYLIQNTTCPPPQPWSLSTSAGASNNPPQNGTRSRRGWIPSRGGGGDVGTPAGGEARASGRTRCRRVHFLVESLIVDINEGGAGVRDHGRRGFELDHTNLLGGADGVGAVARGRAAGRTIAVTSTTTEASPARTRSASGADRARTEAEVAAEAAAEAAVEAAASPLTSVVSRLRESASRPSMSSSRTCGGAAVLVRARQK